MVSGVLLWCATYLVMWLYAEWFIEDTDDYIVWRIWAGPAMYYQTAGIFILCITFAVLPVPMAYLGIGILKALEFVFRRCIEHNKGGFIAFCILVGSLAALYKLFA
jgi:hypothetical protein